MRLNLRTRLLILVMVGVIILTVINVLGAAWGFGRIRDESITVSEQTLQKQAELYLQLLTNARADTTNRTLNTIQQIATAGRDYLTHSVAPAEAVVSRTWRAMPDGRHYSHGTTTVILPAGMEEEQFEIEAALTQNFDALLPGLARELPQIVRISYLAKDGTMRTFPRLEPLTLPKGWTVEQDPLYQASLPERNSLHQVQWTPVRPAYGSREPVISTLAPVYQRGQFQGVLIVDTSLDRLVDYLETMGVEQTGFAFLIDQEGRLIAMPEAGQRRMFGRLLTRSEQGTVILDTQIESLKSALDNMRIGRYGYTITELRGRTYILAYAPITGIRWSLATAAPLDEVIAGSAAVTEPTKQIAEETQLFVLLTSLAAVALLGLVLSYVLRHQFIQPLTELVSMTKAISSGDLRPIPVSGVDELGQLALSFNSMTTALESSRAEILSANEGLERTVRTRTSDLEQAIVRLEDLSKSQKHLLQVLHEVSTPVIPVISGVLVMPLIGQLDDERMRQATAALLGRIERERSHTALIDITGAPVIDTHVAQGLIRLVDAAQLLGARVMLVGITPEVAQTLVALGIDLSRIRTTADLQSGVEMVMASMRKGEKTHSASAASHRNR